jgi:uncharacterized membrane protein YfhO
VDGEAAPVLLANHALRAIPVPAGEHQLLLSYDPPLLRFGIAVTLGTMFAIAAVWGGLAYRGTRQTRRTQGSHP